MNWRKRACGWERSRKIYRGLEKSAFTEMKNVHGKMKTVRFGCGLSKRHGGDRHKTHFSDLSH